MIYQNPFGSLNPTLRVGAQIAETLRVNRGLSKKAAKDEALALLERVEIEDPERRSAPTRTSSPAACASG